MTCYQINVEVAMMAHFLRCLIYQLSCKIVHILHKSWGKNLLSTIKQVQIIGQNALNALRDFYFSNFKLANEYFQLLFCKADIYEVKYISNISILNSLGIALTAQPQRPNFISLLKHNT